SKIDGVVAEASLQDSKNKAKKDLEQKATDTKAAIDKLTGVSDGDKEKAKAEVEAALKDGETAIEKATDTKGVDDAV
ncbi:DUF1542 domain-containing protein, partial [Leuconostoc citreum]